MSIEYILNEEGRLFRRTTDQREVRLTADLAGVFSNDVSIKFPKFMKIHNEISCGMTVKRSMITFTCHLPRLRIRCPWKAGAGGIVTPDWKGNTAPLELFWDVPKDADLCLLITVYCDLDGAWSQDKTYLFLMSTTKDGKGYRIPTSNLFENGEMCTGLHDLIKMPTARAAAEFVFDQVDRGVWRNDLMPAPEKSAALFRFKPTDVGFEQVPMEQDWRQFCYPIGNSKMEEIV